MPYFISSRLKNVDDVLPFKQTLRKMKHFYLNLNVPLLIESNSLGTDSHLEVMGKLHVSSRMMERRAAGSVRRHPGVVLD